MSSIDFPPIRKALLKQLAYNARHNGKTKSAYAQSFLDAEEQGHITAPTDRQIVYAAALSCAVVGTRDFGGITETEGTY